jgi:hypothetical protein
MDALTSKYVLDTSIFIQAHRVYYALDIAPAFWNFLKTSADENALLSIDRVFDEILKGKDELTNWASKEFSTAFADSKKDPNILQKYANIMQWANNQTQYTQNAKDEFARAENADAWVIAYSLTYDFTIVTQEVLDENIKRKIPIPNVSKAFNIRYINTFTLLRELKFQFK